ncbi:MAG: glycerol-3-phosphate 1-O-acyltransferase PlsY [Acidobacteriota bacterium]
MLNVVLLLVGAYLLGSIPFSYIVVRLVTGKDVRQEGSGNVGATNALRTGGKLAGFLALLFDALKGVAAVFLARLLGASEPLFAAAAVAVVLGHMYPVFLGFHGGKGVATAAGALGSLRILPFGLTLLTFLLVVKLSRWVSLGSIVAVCSFPFYMWLFGVLAWTAPPSPGLLISASSVVLLIVIKHAGNIRRLFDRTERRLGETPTPDEREAIV